MSDVSFKIVLQDKKRPETKHRFRGDFTYAQLTDLLSHLWGGKKKLVVEYTDEDGDDILVLTEVEWQECVRLHLKRLEESRLSSLPLALRVRQEKKVLCGKKGHHHRRQAKEGTATAEGAAVPTVPKAASAHVDVNDSVMSSDYDSDSEGIAYVTPSENSAIRRSGMNRTTSAVVSTNTSMHITPAGDHAVDAPAAILDEVSAATFTTTTATPAATAAKKADDAPAHLVEFVPRLHLSAIGRRMSRQPSSEITANDDDAALMSLLSLIFRCDATMELYHPSMSPSPLSAVMTTPPTKDARGQVHVDIDLQRVKRLAIAKANERMDTDPTQSRAILEAALQLFGNDSLVLYNLSCAAACEQNFETALMWLESALGSGYRSYETISVDHDFDNLRSDARFQALMNAYFPESIVKTEPTTPAVVPAPVSVASEAPVASTVVAPAPEPISTTTAVPAPRPVPVEDVTVIPAATPRTTTMMSVFPSMTQKEAKSLLQLANNNVNVAIDWKLGHQQ
ncbi:Hypothetical protein, putative [Bodo saltans]|uniref:PB1 domain-containing protein n=1 Tax=Bodo saltans TaxID=75058 RepID=A0A0S4J229_BODSA|nr:Hypothetical protein, putative [Bodo saltans]|eukprot:CUG58120.1 Hypothetical protein, putative [Bodo saltans]